MGNSRLVLSFLVAITLSSRSFGGRVLYSPLVGDKIAYVTITNPSTYTQTVDVTFRASGIRKIYTTTAAGFQAGSSGVSCASATVCTNKSTFRVLPPGESFFFAIKADGAVLGGSGSGSSSNGGIYVEISVQEDTGFLVGQLNFGCMPAGSAACGDSNTVTMPINGGRPF